MVANESDRELIEACQRGEREAFASLFAANRDRVYSIALRYTGDGSAAMDIAQDVFLKLLTRIGQFRSSACFETWLYRMVVNSCLDYQRRRRKLIPLLDTVFNAVRTASNKVLQDIMQEQQEEMVQRVIAALPPEQRIVVVLRYTEDLSYERIGDIVGCSPGTVASRLNRAHKVLERRLSGLREERRVDRA